MAFSVQSEFLDLKKVYQNFEYEALTSDEKVIADGVLPENNNVYEGMTQNTYLFVTEKGVLIKDVENIAQHFMHKWIRPNSKIRQKAFEAFPFEKVKDRVCYIFQKYQQQPSLLDSLLEHLILPIMNAIKEYLYLLLVDSHPPCEDFHSLLMIVYQLTKVRGKKYTIKYFPHEVKDLEPAVAYLVRLRTEQNTQWESKYMILLWLSVIILMPFDLATIDSNYIEITNDQGEKVHGMIETLLETSKFYLKSSTKMREAASFFLSKMFTRPDIQKMNLLFKYISYVLDQLATLKDDQINSFFICGLYCSLKDIFKAVARSELLEKIAPVIVQMRNEAANERQSPAKKLLKMKLLTRIGMVYLKPRVAKWAYRKSKKSLRDNLNKTGQSKLKTNSTVSSLQRNEDNYGESNENQLEYYKDVVKANLEEIIDLIIEALSEKETSIRQAASKGLGMICGRLSPDMIEDILIHILDLNPCPQSQHSICLTLAELIRRNLLSPQRLRSLYPLIHESLLYEKEEGGYSIGQAVRDAACYMTWAVARGYEDGGELGIPLMIAACFDREVGCRRAASAAYQELVGRVGGVPNGIEVLTEADYFTLGLQKNSYLNVGIFVASYEPYFKPFVEHLGYQKLRHWDLEVKRIAACSLSLMCPLNPQFMADELLPALVNYMQADAMTTKLGSVIGIGEVLIGLAGKSHIHQLHNEMKDSVFLKSLTQNDKKLIHAGEYMTIFKEKYEKQKHTNHLQLLQPKVVEQIVQNLKKYLHQNIYKGKAGENFRVATCRLLECIALSGIPMKDEDVVVFTNFMEDNIKNPVEGIINAAVKSLKPFSQQYHTVENQTKLVDHIIQHAVTFQPFAQGYTLALSSLSSKLKEFFFEKILTALESNCKILKEKEDDAIRRKNSVIGLESLVESLGFQSECLNTATIERIFGILFRTLNDYSTDKRGDIGSVVREASMKTLINIIAQYTQSTDRKGVISDKLAYQTVANMLQQLSEKIDRIRLLTGSLLQTYFDYYSKFFEIPRRKELELLFQQENIKRLIREGQQKVDRNLETEVIEMEMRIQQNVFQEKEKYLIYYWNLPHCVFAVVTPLLEYPEYSYYILKGLSTSAGGISESVIKFSLQELGTYISYVSKAGHHHLIEQLLIEAITILEKHFRDQRVVVPMYKTLDYVLEREEIASWKGLFDLSSRLYSVLSREIAKSKMILKISSGVGLYVHLLKLKNESIQSNLLTGIVQFLSSDLPKVRKILADKLLLLVMSQQEYETFNQEQSDELTMLLSEYDFIDEKLDCEHVRTELQRIFFGL